MVNVMKAKTLLIFGLALLSVASAMAQQVRWQLPDPQFAIGKSTPLELVFENCSPKGDPVLPEVDGLGSFGAPVGRQKQVSIVNFRPTQREVLSYFVRPTRAGRIEVSAFEVETNAGTLKVPALSFEVDAQARLSSTGERVDHLVRATLETSPAEVWQGEVFTLRYEILLLGNQQASLAGDLSTWAPDGLRLAPWPESQNVRRNLGGFLRVGRLFETKAMAEKAGTLELPPVEMDVDLISGRTFGLFGPFGGGQAERIRVPSNPVKLTVKSLPQPAPAGFTGAVGQFRLESRLTPATVAAGEPVTWSVTIRGKGNWPANFEFPTRRVPGSMRVIEPEVRRETSPENPFEASATQDIVIIPREPGTVDLPALQFTFFNPATGEYETLMSEPAQLIVTGDQPGGTLSTSPQRPSAPVGDKPLITAAVPEPGPVALPRDPLSGTGTTVRPVPVAVWVGAGAAWFLALLPFWLVLARKEAVRRHPNRARQLAWEESRQAVEAVGREGAERRVELLRWMQAVARSQGVDRPCPTLAEIETTPLFADARWAELWRQAEACVFGDIPLPTDWVERARTAAAGFRPPPVPWAATFRPAYWLPVVLMLGWAGVTEARADAGAEAYRNGDFAAARAAWEAEVKASPGNWVARNNLGLALAQAGDWDGAAAQWARAWLAAPRNPEVTWNLKLGLSKASYQAPDFRRMSGETWSNRVSTLLSPGAWQLVFVGGSAWAALGLAMLLLCRHTQRSVWSKLGHPSWLGGLVLMLVAGLALAHYGILADPEAALVVETTPLKSVPTDAAVEQVEKKAQAGLLVRQEHRFLGWTRIALPNKETGWIRSEALLPLHRDPELSPKAANLL